MNSLPAHARLVSQIQSISTPALTRILTELDVLNKANFRGQKYDRTIGIAWSHVHSEYRQRIIDALRERSDGDLAATLRGLTKGPSTEFTATERVLRDTLEQVLGERYPVAAHAVDEYIDDLNVDNLPEDEYAHLRLLLDVAGL